VRKLRYLVIALLLAGMWLHLGAVSGGAASNIDGGTTDYASSEATPFSSADDHGDKVESAGYIPFPGAAYSDDNYPVNRWGIIKIEAPQAWQVAKGGQQIIVAVLDTGIDEDNQDLADKLLAQVNFTNSPTSNDLYGHGTHMAGTIVAVAPECQLMNVKVADDIGRCQASAVARGITWAVNQGADVINVSLCVEASPDLEEAVNYAWSQGALIIAAAGNGGKSIPAYPAYYANCLAVAATDEDDSLALLSNHGDWVDVAAPGFGIYSELPHNVYGYESGTSAAAAHVSGVAALVFTVAEDSNSNGAVNDEVRQAIEDSCSPIGVDGVGNGRIDAFEAVTAAISLD
jgi:thermitase